VTSSTEAGPGISGSSGDVWAVLVAAGRGERLGEDRPKSFASLGGRALLAESVERLEGSDWIDAIVVVAPEGWEEPTILLVEELTAGKVTATVTGGASRGESVRIGVGEVSDEAAAILVHDAARPLLPEELVERLLVSLGEGWDGVVPGLPVIDTVKRVEGDRVVETLPRGQLVAVQTPQVFVAAALRSALEDAVEGASDCASLVEARGGRVRVVPGDPRLLKVTTRADLDLVQSWL
jgi:2-C-methyl-D-erythritol 4-phosphate cytidylyltransferase